jgi:hypothetical protein
MRRCSACSGQYFAGGLPLFLSVLCIAMPVGIALSAVLHNLVWFFVAITSALAVGIWHTVKVPLLPAHRRWSEVAKIAVSPVLLWAGLEALKWLK